MIPPNIVETAKERGIDVLGITDHNSAENVEAVQAAAEGTGLTVLGGMEVTTAEEVHVLGIFENALDIKDFQRFIYNHLHGSNEPETFGHQWVVDEEGGVIDMNPRLLMGATTLLLDEVVASIHELAGLAIAAHVDRQSFSVVSQLGFIPDGLEVDAIELSPFFGSNAFGEGELQAAGGGDRVRVTFSDAHYVHEIARSSTTFTVAHPTVQELLMAIQGESGRAIVEA